MRSDVGSDNCCFLFLFCRRFFPFPPVFSAVLAVAAGEPVMDAAASESPSGLDSLSSVVILTEKNSLRENYICNMKSCSAANNF